MNFFRRSYQLRAWPASYGVAVICCLAMTALRVILQDTVVQRSTSLSFLAITLSAFFGGLGPGLFAAIFSSLVELYYFIPPSDSFALPTVGYAIQFGIFALGALLVSSLTSSLYEARKSALKYAEQKTHFVANVSHEIRTPMNAVVGLTGLLLDTPLNEDQKNLAMTLKDSAAHLSSLINDVLDFSKLDVKKMKLERTDFDLMTAIRQSINLVEHQAHIKGLDIDMSVETGVPERLYGDSGRLSQILLNLLSNAIKFTEKGKISIRVRRLSGNESIMLRFEIEDTGIGISKDAQERIFEDFFQANPSTTRKYGGTGLGLSICKRLVEMMSGEIGVVSEVGRGSMFWFTSTFDNSLPRTLNQKGQAERWTTPLEKRRRRILVVEDNTVNQLVAVRMLEKLGCRVDAVSNGREAFQILQNISYDAVFMDCHMPEMDGYQTVVMIRKAEKERGGPRVPVFALTAHASLENRQKCLEAGMNGYISKPIDIQALASIIQSLPLKRGINFEILSGLRSQLSSGVESDVIKDLLDVFLEKTPHRLESIEAAITQNNPKGLELSAHCLKSAAGTIGASAMADLCDGLEKIGAAGSTQGARQFFGDLEGEFSFISKQIRESTHWVLDIPDGP